MRLPGLLNPFNRFRTLKLKKRTMALARSMTRNATGSQIGFSLFVWLIMLGLVPASATPLQPLQPVTPPQLPQFLITLDSWSPYYSPASATVPPNTPVRWDNPTASPHTITHDGCVTEEGGCAFDSGSVPPGGAYTIPGLPPGKYPYHCRLHPIMRGTLIVGEQSPT